MSYLFLILSLICFYSVAPAHTEEVLGSLGGLARAVGQLESLLNTHNLHKRSAEYGHREDVNKEDGSGQRSSSFRVWMPYTRHHYDMGPISQCSCPQLDACSFPHGFTVPEYIARSVSYSNDMLNLLKIQYSMADSDRCADAIVDFLCKQYVAPQCVNTTVRYPSDTREHCHRAFSSCPRIRYLSGSLCNTVNSFQVVGDFSLTQCRVPDVSTCGNTKETPHWLAAQIEYLASQNPLPQLANEFGLYGTCKRNFLRLACTQATCESDGRLRGYRRPAECNHFLNCFSDSTIRETLSQALMCNDMEKRREPSGCAGQSEGPCCSYLPAILRGTRKHPRTFKKVKKTSTQ